MRIGIIGTRGIPNRYGGFEELAEKLSAGLLQKGHVVTVYNSHLHPYQEKEWKGVGIVHCYDAEKWLGTAGQFIYDLNCTRHARKQQYHLILFLGYTSSSVWWRWYPKKTVIVSNMDGLEWSRSKYSKPVQGFLRYAEKLAVKHSDHCIADSLAIQSYLKSKYGIDGQYIAYGAESCTESKAELLGPYLVSPGEYYMLMARMEPENNIEMILNGFSLSGSARNFLVVGDTDTRLGRSLVKKFASDDRIRFVGVVYDGDIKHALRRHCRLYFHGHSVGGTNPSLLEAMADGSLIAAHQNEFNQAVLGVDAFYFFTALDVKQLIDADPGLEIIMPMQEHNHKKIAEQYNWPSVIAQYHEFLTACLNKSSA